jgi:hypothetical protein
MLAARFRKAIRQYGLDRRGYQPTLDCGQFLHPARQQLGFGF